MMSSTDQNEPIVSQPTSQPVSQQASRKVSINSDKGLDNPAFEHHHHHHHSSPRRKISSTLSENSHTEIGPARKKSILHNNSQTAHDNYHLGLYLFF